MDKSVSRKKVTQWHLFFQYSSIIISIINGIVIVPIYLHFINIELYGAWLATGNILVWITIIEPGIGDVLQQKIAFSYSQKDYITINKLIASGIIISLIISITAFLASLVIVNYIPAILKTSESLNSGELLTAFKLIAISTCLTLFTFSLVGINQGFQNTFFSGIIYVVGQVVAIILNIILLYMNYGLISIALSRIAFSSIFLTGHLILLIYVTIKNKLTPIFEKNFFIQFSKIFIYTFSGKLASTLINNIDLIIVSRYINAETVTMLELTRRPFKIFNSFIDRSTVALLPALSHLYGEQDYSKLKNLFTRYINIFFWIACLTTFGFIVFNKYLITLWLNKDVFLGNSLNILICLGIFLNSFSYNISNFTFSFGNIAGNNIITIVKSIVYVLFIYILTKGYGIWGIVLAPIISTLSSELWYYPRKIMQILKLSKSELIIIFKDNIILILFTALISATFIYCKIKITDWLHLFIVVAIFSTIYLVFLYSTSLNFRNEVKNTISSFKSILFSQC